MSKRTAWRPSRLRSTTPARLQLCRFARMQWIDLGPTTWPDGIVRRFFVAATETEPVQKSASTICQAAT